MNPLGRPTIPHLQGVSERMGKKDSGSIKDMMGGMGSKIEKGLEQVGHFFDKSRGRQLVFALIVMPAVTALAIQMMMPGIFHGIASMNSFGQGDFMSVPLLGVLVYGTGYCLVRTLIGKRDSLHELVTRMARVAGFPLYCAAYSWFIFHVISVHGLITTHYSTPIAQHTNFLHNINHPYSVNPGGVMMNGWLPMLLLGSIPLNGLLENMIEETRKIGQEMNCRVLEGRAQTQRDLLKINREAVRRANQA